MGVGIPGEGSEGEQASPGNGAGAPRLALGGGVVGDYAENLMAARPWFMPATSGVTWRVGLADDLPGSAAGRVSGTGRMFRTPELARETPWILVRLTPLSAYRVLGAPLDEFVGTDVDLGDVYGRTAHQLLEALRESAPGQRRFELVRAYVAARAEQGPEPAPEVARAWRRLVATGGRTPIAGLAAEVGWSHQHLLRKFRQQLGRPPKTMARLIRFRNLVQRLDPVHPAPWDRLAAEHGYYDQAHLYRDFHEFAGTTPARYLAALLPCGCLSDPEVHSFQDTAVAAP
ncbi:helix-turn-helix domain-containing protein [Embleya sp. AB8]|uniref:AraC family transcriptional regulator n=1 Tax=Embleya sp. AB8 TaxID=3156304 RepID=UPI003C71AB50